MSATERPGGLTALAVLNFVFGGFAVLGALGLLVMTGVMHTVQVDPQNAQHVQESKDLIAKWLLLLVGMTAISAFLLIASGVGYLQQKRVLGRYLGNAYAMLSLLGTVLGLTLMHQKFGIGSIIGLVYPVLTVYLLNTVFRDDLVN